MIPGHHIHCFLYSFYCLIEPRIVQILIFITKTDHVVYGFLAVITGDIIVFKIGPTETSLHVKLESALATILLYTTGADTGGGGGGGRKRKAVYNRWTGLVDWTSYWTDRFSYKTHWDVF